MEFRCFFHIFAGRNLTDKKHEYEKDYAIGDSPSLNHADVGIAMGSGTSVAKEAADIVLLNDAFPSIVLGIKWGRSLYKNIQSFLSYQLMINVAACLTVLFGPILGQDMPFGVILLITVNLAMDSLAALALASEPADPNVMYDKPRDKNAFIITKDMYKVILGMGSMIFIILAILIWNIGHPGFLPFATDTSIVFAVFMAINWWQLFNVRVMGKNRSIFHKIGSSGNFLIGSLAIILATILVVQLGGNVSGTRPLSIMEWILIFAATSPIVIVREIWFWLKKK